MASDIAILGAGSWGTALAHHLAGCGHAVRLWAFEPEVADAVNRTRENPLFLAGVPLHAGIVASSDLAATLAGATAALFVTPSHVARQTLRAARPHLPAGAPVLVATKGLETDTLQTMAEVFAEELAPAAAHPLAFVSGPSFAREVAAGLPTAVTVASRDAATARTAQALLSSEGFRAYTTDDVAGVEIGGALKNVVAIAAGIGDGLALGNNARSALITRGLAEMTRLGVCLGAQAQTFSGLAGMGDLVLTCTGDLSRNRRVGLELGRGRKLPEILEGMSMVAEGVRTTRALKELAGRGGMEMPITEKMYEILYGGKSAAEAVGELMSREPRSER